MANEYERRVLGQTATAAEIDEGLRAHMLRVYNYMVGGLGITGIVAYTVANVPSGGGLFYQLVTVTGGFTYSATLLGWIAIFAPLALVFFLSFRIQRMSFSAAQSTFWIFAALMGVSLASILWVYTGASIARVFFITASMFGAMSLWGYTTKRDLTGMGQFMMMGLIGIVIAMVVNIFLASAMMDFVISVIGVVVFTGLTAYDTQKIKEMYTDADATDVAGKKAIMGALRLYLDFINLFLMLLRLFGNRN